MLWSGHKPGRWGQGQGANTHYFLYKCFYFSCLDGWRYEKSYRFLITHLPECGIIRLKLYEGAKQLHDSGDIVDNGPESLRGGRLGVYCDSQENIMWSALSYKCISAKDCNATTTMKP